MVIDRQTIPPLSLPVGSVYCGRERATASSSFSRTSSVFTLRPVLAGVLTISAVSHFYVHPHLAYIRSGMGDIDVIPTPGWTRLHAQGNSRVMSIWDCTIRLPELRAFRHATT